MNKKTVIIGVDGVPFGLMDNLSDQGVMPHFKKLKKQGWFGKMRSSIPPISSISWSSIITGKNPAEHGIFGFIEIMPDTYSLKFPDFNSLKTPAFWQEEKRKKFVILNVPSTYPAKRLNGVHISGFISLDLQEAVYPKNILPFLEKKNYQIDVDSSLAHQSKTLFLKKLNETLEHRIEIYRYFWKQIDWDVFMLVFTGSDRIGHFLWDAYEEKNHPHHQAFLDHFAKIDQVIGEIAGKLSPQDSLLMLSDHGMTRIKTNVNVNAVLLKKGFLDLNEKFKNFQQITSKTTAFALDPGRIYLHLKDKYPKGKVKKNEKEKIIKKLVKVFSSLKYKNQKIIQTIHRKEEIYQGRFIDQGPDLILLAKQGFRLRGMINKKEIFDKDIFTGHHTFLDSFLYVKTPEKIDIPEKIRVEDFRSILNQILSN